MLEAIPRPMLEDSAYEAIKAAILSLSLAPGTPLIESSLAKQLGISKTPVRAGLTRLEKEGLVELMPHKGWRVARLTLQDVEDIFEVRSVLQAYCVRILTENITNEQIEELRDIVSRNKAALTKGQRGKANDNLGEFDACISNSLPNDRLRTVLTNLREQLRLIGAISRRIPDRVEKSIAEHQRVLDAIEAHDAERAQQLIRAHIESVRTDFVQAMALLEDEK